MSALRLDAREFEDRELEDREALAGTARLLGELWLRELDRVRWEELSRPDLREALEEVGIELPADPSEATFGDLAAEYFEVVVQPKEGGPLVQSLWSGGTFEGEPAVALRKLAKDLDFGFDRGASRGAPVDHLGSILWLWSEVALDAPAVAMHLERTHLAWAEAPLARLRGGTGFYAGLAGASADFLATLLALPEREAAGTPGS